MLDTNVLSELRRPEQAHLNVINWAGSMYIADLYLSAVTVLELEIGCLRIERRDAVQGRILRNWIETSVLVRYRSRILPLDTRVAQICASLHVPDPKSDRDAMIAATAIAHDFTLVTRNIADFQATGAKLLNPWEDA
jgi:toxin FitB